MGAGLGLRAYVGPCTASKRSGSGGPSQPLSGENRVWASPRLPGTRAKSLQQLGRGPCAGPPGALEEECGLINSQKLKGLALWEQLPGQACQDATGPACRSLSAEGSEGDRRRGAGRQELRGQPPASRHTRVLWPFHGR